MDFNPLSVLSSFLSPSTTAGGSSKPPLSTPPFNGNVETTDVKTPATEGGLTFAKGTKGAGGEFGTLAYDPAQSASILANLEKFRDQRVKLANPNDDPLYEAVAWGQTYPGGQGLQNLEARRTKKSEMLKDAFDAQMQIDQFKAAQRNQERESAQKQQILGKFGMGAPGGDNAGAPGGGGNAGAPGGGNFGMTEPMARALVFAKPGEEFNKLYSDWAKSYEENEHKFATSPEAYKQYEYYDGNGKLQKYTPQEIRSGKPQIDAARYKKNPDENANTLPILSNPIMDGLHEAVLGQESSGGKADTSKPNLQGAIGPGQFLPGTWKQYQDKKVIPDHFDINNPEHNKAATRLLLGHYYDKYNGDINKVLAAYHGGEGSIRKDGTINTDAKDALGVSNEQYISGVKSKIPGSFTNEPATKVASSDGKSFGEFQVEQKGKEERVTKESGVVGEEVGKRRNVLETAYKDADSNLANVTTITNLATTHPKAFGVLQHPTVLSAIGNMFKSGFNAGDVSSHISSIEEAIRQASPGMKEEDITAAQEAVSKLAQLELNAAKAYLKGQGAVSDAERALIAKLTGSISNSPQALIDILKANEISFRYNKDIGTQFKEWKKSNKGSSFEDFEDSDLYKTTGQKYKKQLDDLAANAGKYAGSTNPATAKQPPAPPPGYNPNWRSIVKGLAGGTQ